MAVAPILIILFPGLAEALNLPIHNVPLLLTMWVLYMVTSLSVTYVLKLFYFPKFPHFFTMPGPGMFVFLVGQNVLLILRTLATILGLSKFIARFIILQLCSSLSLARLNAVQFIFFKSCPILYRNGLFTPIRRLLIVQRYYLEKYLKIRLVTDYTFLSAKFFFRMHIILGLGRDHLLWRIKHYGLFLTYLHPLDHRLSRLCNYFRARKLPQLPIYLRREHKQWAALFELVGFFHSNRMPTNPSAFYFAVRQNMLSSCYKFSLYQG